MDEIISINGVKKRHLDLDDCWCHPEKRIDNFRPLSVDEENEGNSSKTDN